MMTVDSDRPRPTLDEILKTVERDEILAALGEAGGQRTRAAWRLGISRSRLYRRMDALAIDPRVGNAGAAPTGAMQPIAVEDEAPTRSAKRLDTALARVERDEILSALQEAGEQRTLAARRLGISRSRLYRRMDTLGIHG